MSYWDLILGGAVQAVCLALFLLGIGLVIEQPSWIKRGRIVGFVALATALAMGVASIKISAAALGVH